MNFLVFMSSDILSEIFGDYAVFIDNAMQEYFTIEKELGIFSMIEVQSDHLMAHIEV